MVTLLIVHNIYLLCSPPLSYQVTENRIAIASLPPLPSTNTAFLSLYMQIIGIIDYENILLCNNQLRNGRYLAKYA